jgi:cell division septation protein DedD
MSGRRSKASSGSWIATLGTLAALVLVGFSVGVIGGILWEEPRLVLAHLTGGTTEIAWTADASPAVAVEEGDVEPAAVAAAEAAPTEAPRKRVAPAAKLPPVAAAPPGRVAIQVGAFAESEAAESLVTTLRDRGYAAYVTPGARSGAARWRVRVGPLADRDEAERIAARLKREEKLPTWVLDEDGG